jgi:hypothetical protein
MIHPNPRLRSQAAARYDELYRPDAERREGERRQRPPTMPKAAVSDNGEAGGVIDSVLFMNPALQ